VVDWLTDLEEVVAFVVFSAVRLAAFAHVEVLARGRHAAVPRTEERGGVAAVANDVVVDGRGGRSGRADGDDRSGQRRSDGGRENDGRGSNWGGDGDEGRVRVVGGDVGEALGVDIVVIALDTYSSEEGESQLCSVGEGRERNDVHL
jgi:hypothetical protein